MSSLNLQCLGNTLHRIFNQVLEWLYPSNIYCMCCNDFIDSNQPYALCPACVQKLHWIVGTTCAKCGKSIEKEGFCTDCELMPRYFDKGISCVQYGRMEKELIHRFKYRDGSYMGKKFAMLMAERLEIESFSVDLIVSVPMFYEKEKVRGYNQASILARELSRYIGTHYGKAVLFRMRNTVPMSELSAEERAVNVKNAFTVSQKWYKMIQDKTILLVDDVFTTGNTVNECSRVLKECGAKKVYFLTFASGVGR